MGNKVILYTLGGCLLLSYCLWWVQENDPPKVAISQPEMHSSLRWGAVVPFLISIADREDGSSEYGEIESNEVILTTKYLSDANEAQDYIRNEVKNNMPILSWMGRANCFSCHSAKHALIGPSFEDIANRYQTNVTIQETLINKIRNGATGTWGDQIMPAHPDLDPNMLKKVVSWIIDKNTDTSYTYYSGLEGAIQIKQDLNDKTNNEVCVLIAYYLDHGLKNGMESEKSAEHALVFRIE